MVTISCQITKSKNILKKISRNNKVILFGGGKITEQMLVGLNQRYLCNIRVCDSNVEKQGKFICGIRIESPEILVDNKDLVIISVEKYAISLEIYQYIKKFSNIYINLFDLDKIINKDSTVHIPILNLTIYINEEINKILKYIELSNLLNAPKTKIKLLNDAMKYKDIHKGKRVFLIGNGPSLNFTPLHQLINEYTIAMNRISLIYSKTIWRPSYFICSTSNILREDWARDINQTISYNIPTFAWDKLKPFINNRQKNVIFLNCRYGDRVEVNPPLKWWSNDICNFVCKYGTSMLFAIQVAVYMGFKDIYLVGCDLGFRDNTEKDLNHFDSNYGTPGFNAEILNSNMIGAHKLAKRATEMCGVNIYNATIGGNLEVFQRVDLQSLLS